MLLQRLLDGLSVTLGFCMTSRRDVLLTEMHYSCEWTGIRNLPTVTITGSSLVNRVEDTGNSRPKNGHRW